MAVAFLPLITRIRNWMTRENTLRKVKITIGPVELYARLLDTPAADAIRKAMPFSSRAKIADSAVVFATPGRKKLRSGAPGMGRPGDFVLCGASGDCGIDFSNLPFTRIKRQGPRRSGDVWARAFGDIAALKHVIDGDPVAVEGVE